MFRNRNFPPGYFFKSAVKVLIGGTTAFGFFEFFNGNEKFHENVAIPLVHKLFDPETAHRLGVLMAKYKLLPWRGSSYIEYEELKTKVFDMDFVNPLGLAAGFDKNGEAISGLMNAGFGFIEIGSVTPQAQPGNAKPRVFRLNEDYAVINRYGFNSDGHSVVVDRLKKLHSKNQNEKKANNHSCLIGVNLGKNKTSTDADADYSQGLMTFVPYADYIVINVSSPNTPGLRDMQRKKELQKLLLTMKKTINALNEPLKRVPLLLKVSPDLSADDLNDVAALCNDKSNGIYGLIVTNTTVNRPDSLQNVSKNEIGGLSGKPLKVRSTNCVKDFRKLTKGRMPIIACGGVSTGEDAYEKIRAGASLVQLYTGLVYQGYPIVGRIKRELVECLKRDGFSNVEQAVGADCPLK